MIRSEKKYVLAWTHKQALHFARSMMGWARSEWQFVDAKGDALRGLYGVVLYDIRAPRYQPSLNDRENMERCRREIVDPGLQSGRIVKINVVNLP